MIARFIRCVLFLAFGLFTYTLIRALFFWLNAQTLSQLTGDEIFASFMHGVRFDLATLLWINGILFILYLFPWGSLFSHRITRRILFVVFGALNFLSFLCQFFDMEYFKFRGKRLTPAGLVGVTQGLGDAWRSMIDYSLLWTLLAIVSASFLWILAHTIRPQPRRMNPGLAFAVYLLALGAICIGARGGLQAKPLIPAHAFNTTPLATQLTLNSAFTLLRTRDDSVEPLHYFTDWSELQNVLGQLPERSKPIPSRPNFVVIIVESLGSEYRGTAQNPAGYTPFINELAQSGVDFPLSFANGRRSIDALMSIFAGIPNLMDASLITSGYQTNKIMGLPKILGEIGYDSGFFHGGYDGSMFFDTQAAILGFKRYVGANAYGNDQDTDGHWGVYDEPFLQFTAAELGRMQQPFFAGIFTLSSHYPYLLPPNHQNEFPKGSLAIHESIGYADFALRRFFETVRTAPWFDNTIFVFTGDHTSLSDQTAFQTPLGQFRVPLIFYSPKGKLPLTLDEPVQQIDIMPTILAITGASDYPHARFGQSLYEKSRRASLLFGANTYYLVSGKQVIAGAPDQGFETYHYLDDPYLRERSLKDQTLERELKAKLQYYRNGLIEDRLQQP